MQPKDAEEIANSVDPDQTASLIWVCTVCPDLSVRKLRKIMVVVMLKVHDHTEYYKSARMEMNVKMQLTFRI